MLHKTSPLQCSLFRIRSTCIVVPDVQPPIVSSLTTTYPCNAPSSVLMLSSNQPLCITKFSSVVPSNLTKLFIFPVNGPTYSSSGHYCTNTLTLPRSFSTTFQTIPLRVLKHDLWKSAPRLFLSIRHLKLSQLKSPKVCTTQLTNVQPKLQSHVLQRM